VQNMSKLLTLLMRLHKKSDGLMPWNLATIAEEAASSCRSQDPLAVSQPLVKEVCFFLGALMGVSDFKFPTRLASLKAMPLEIYNYLWAGNSTD
jgi:hypothetical protein